MTRYVQRACDSRNQGGTAEKISSLANFICKGFFNGLETESVVTGQNRNVVYINRNKREDYYERQVGADQRRCLKADQGE